MDEILLFYVFRFGESVRAPSSSLVNAFLRVLPSYEECAVSRCRKVRLERGCVGGGHVSQVHATKLAQLVQLIKRVAPFPLDTTFLL